jgi:nucleoside-diphosphate-sugar epimerase/SAM-dependent methyltransferase
MKWGNQMKVLITGGTGFIGSRLALKCQELKYEVKVLGLEQTTAETQNAVELKQKGIKVEPVSMLNREELERHLKDIDVVYHLAAAQHEMNVQDKHFWDVNVEGTRNVLDASVNAGIKRFVHGSTIGVYGIVSGLIDEKTPCNPENIYGVTKFEGDKLALSYNEKLPIVVIRIPEVYGPGDRRLLKLFKVIKNNTFFMIGNGENLHHLVYVDDLIESFFLASEKDEAVGQVFLVAGEKALSTNEIVKVIAEKLGSKGARFRVPFLSSYILATTMEFALRPLGIQPPLHRRRMDFFKKSFELSWMKAAEKLNYQPKVSFEEGVARTVNWYIKTGLLQPINLNTTKGSKRNINAETYTHEELKPLPSKFDLKARIEPFDSFWEAPEDIEKGFVSFGAFYKYNYLRHFPSDKKSRILVISCGPGYMVSLLNQNGYYNVLGIDSIPKKISPAKFRNLNCEPARAFDFLDENQDPYDMIFCEQEINHLTKDEIFIFLKLCHKNLRDNGLFIIHSLNGANPIVGSENLALNIDHYNLFTEKSLIQVLEYANYRHVKAIPLKLYIFYKNPLNYVGIALDAIITRILRYAFKFYGKSNRIFTKKIAAICQK